MQQNPRSYGAHVFKSCSYGHTLMLNLNNTLRERNVNEDGIPYWTSEHNLIQPIWLYNPWTCQIAENNGSTSSATSFAMDIGCFTEQRILCYIKGMYNKQQKGVIWKQGWVKASTRHHTHCEWSLQLGLCLQSEEQTSNHVLVSLDASFHKPKTNYNHQTLHK